MKHHESVLVHTPEGIEFALLLAGPFSRMLAFTIDFSVIAAAEIVFTRLTAPLQLISEDAFQSVLIILYFATSLLYGILTEWLWRGQTIGKRLLGLRVVEASGLRLRPSQVVVRNIMRFIDLLPGLYLVGGVSCILSRRRQRLGDLAAGTIVIRTPQLREPDVNQLLGNKFNSFAAQRNLTARLRQKVRPEIAQLALEAMLRRDQLRAGARLALFCEFADYFRSIVPFPIEVTEQLSNEQYVRNAVDVLFKSASIENSPFAKSK
jgi:uncharacterized RDD family membrane protein YckC